MLAHDGRADRARPLHPWRRTLGARSLRRGHLALRSRAHAVLPERAEDGGDRTAGGCRSAPQGLLGQALPVCRGLGAVGAAWAATEQRLFLLRANLLQCRAEPRTRESWNIDATKEPTRSSSPPSA